jgi:hypothetical protein
MASFGFGFGLVLGFLWNLASCLFGIFGALANWGASKIDNDFF